MVNKVLLTVLNNLYEKYGFEAVLTEVRDRLTYGEVTLKDDGLYCITTHGFSDDEELVHTLTNILCRFGYFHYVGYLRGGAYYFTKNKHEMNVEITYIKNEKCIK